MKYIRDICNSTIEDSVVILGNFDGIHKGHLTLIHKAISIAKERGLKTALFTFHPHPTHVLPIKEVSLINTDEEKRVIAEHEGIDYYIEYPFTLETAHMEAKAFTDMLAECCKVKAIVVGEDYHYGRGRHGDIHVMEEEGKLLGFDVFPISKLKHTLDNGVSRVVSSTWIREAVSVADIDLANQLMGREYMITGQVVEGAHIGRTIGFPTANLKPEIHKQLPRNGVYITEVDYKGIHYPALTNVGTKPTIDENLTEVLVETYLHGFDQMIYGETIHVRFHKYLRTEDKFNSLDELVARMNLDKKAMFDYFKIES